MNTDNNNVSIYVSYWTNEWLYLTKKLYMGTNVRLSIPVEKLYLENILINISEKYVRIYVSIE